MHVHAVSADEMDESKTVKNNKLERRVIFSDRTEAD